eukprot:SAG31_NODE_26724_length_437_cov_1.295858_1_plen_41_part_10
MAEASERIRQDTAQQSQRAVVSAIRIQQHMARADVATTCSK